jgi:hypothetical protein
MADSYVAVCARNSHSDPLLHTRGVLRSTSPTIELDPSQSGLELRPDSLNVSSNPFTALAESSRSGTKSGSHHRFASGSKSL